MRARSLLVLCLAVGSTSVVAAPEKPIHRFMQVAMSPDAAHVASVEGAVPNGVFYPPIRELVIRSVRGAVTTTIDLPCGRVPECWPGSLAWSPDGTSLTFALRRPGSHARSLYTVSADGHGLRKLLAFSGTIEDLRYSSDGRLAMLATANADKEVGATEAGAPVAGDLDGPTPEQRIAILEGNSLHWASPPELFVYEYDWRPHGEGFVGTAAPGDGDNNWWTAKLYSFAERDGAAKLLYAPRDGRQQLTTPKVSRDGSVVAFIAGIMSDFGSIGGDVFALPLRGGPAVNLTPAIHASAADLVWRCDDHLQAQLLADDKTEFVDLGPGLAPLPQHAIGTRSDSLAMISGHISTACPSDMTATDHESFLDPPEIMVGRVGDWHDLTSINAGHTLSSFSVQSLHWKSDGFDVQGWLLLPAGVQRRMPMVTVVHGGPAAAQEPFFADAGLEAALLTHGYAIFYPNPRGSFGQGERFTLANVRDFGHGDLRDILTGVDAAKKAAPIDEARLGITGTSYGGFMTMWAVTQTPRFKAAVAGAGVSDWLSYYGENGIDAWMLPYFGASVYDEPAVYARSSPINFIRQARTPTFAWVGERDIECPAPQTQEFWHALKTLGVPASIMIYPGEGHGLRDPQHRADALARSLAWFDKYLK
jgi:dipeptidyl aminopeptidase/acylaminoacyl peptidase